MKCILVIFALAAFAHAAAVPCEDCAIFPTNNNPATVECSGRTAPQLADITFTSAGLCGTPRLGQSVTGFEGSCRSGEIVKTLAVLDECDQETDRTASFTTRVIDSTGPIISCPASAQVGNCVEALEQITALQVTATDACSDPFVDKSAIRTINEDGSIRGYEVTFNAFDGCENRATPCIVQLTCSDGADLELIKGSNIEDCAVAGDEEKDIRYTIRVTNKGSDVARNVVVTETYPGGGILIRRGAITTSVGEVTETATGFRWVIGDMAVRQVETISFRFFLHPSYPVGIIENVARAVSDTRDPDLCNNEDRDFIRVCHESDLSVTKTDNEVQVTAGELVGLTPKVHVYEIVVRNNGVSDASNVRLVDEWPAGFLQGQISVGEGGACFNNQQGSGFHCRWTNIPAGASRTVVVTYTVPPNTLPGPQINSVHVSSDSKDDNTENNHAHDVTWVRTEADIAITKDDEVDDVTAGDGQTYTYSIRVVNNGPSVAREVRIVDIWPSGITPVPGTLQTTQGSCTSNRLPAGSFSCNVGELAPGQAARVTIQYTVPADTRACDINNVVNAMSTTYDPNTCNNDASDTNAVLERAELRVTKTANVQQIQIGDVTAYQYQIAVYNYGPSAARQVQVTDTWPSCFTQFKNTLRASQGGCVTTGGDFSCALGTLPAGRQGIITVLFTLSEQVRANRLCNNTAVAFSPSDGTCRSDWDTILVVDELKKRSDGSLHTENIHVSARSISLFGQQRTLTLNMTNPHDHLVAVQQIQVDAVTLQGADACIGVIAAESSRVCTITLAVDKKPESVVVSGTGRDASTPLVGKAHVNRD